MLEEAHLFESTAGFLRRPLHVVMVSSLTTLPNIWVQFMFIWGIREKFFIQVDDCSGRLIV